MNWAEIKKSINSDLGTPLNTKIDSQTTLLTNLINSRPKGYKLQLDSYEHVNLKSSVKTYVSNTGGLVKVSLTGLSSSDVKDIKIDGVSVKSAATTLNTGVSCFMNTTSTSSYTLEIPFGNSIEITGANGQNTATIAVYKNVPIT